ncbi:MAG: YqhG family protein [Sporolactobacillus sp.]
MQQAEIHDYLIRFFSASGCTLLPASRPGSPIKVKLTEKMDQLLMNRPFYWHYIKQIGGTPETATLLLRTNDQSKEGEFLHFGAPRLHQIFDTAKKLGPYIRLYQKIPEGRASALEPWIGINMKISYQCDLKKDRVSSMGLQLINGTMIEGFQEMLGKLDLSPRLPNYLYTLRPLITVESGIKRIARHIEDRLKAEPIDWANDAGSRWIHDQELLNSFYEHQDQKPESYFQEKEALKQQYQPRIEASLINAGLFYLQSASFIPHSELEPVHDMKNWQKHG